MRREQLQCLANLCDDTPDELSGDTPDAAHGDFLRLTRHGVAERDRGQLVALLHGISPNDALLFLLYCFILIRNAT